MRIFVAHDGGSGCMWYRMSIPLDELGRHDGYEIKMADAGDSEHPPSVTLRDMDGYDVIVGQRLNKHDGMGEWRKARTPFSRLVYDLDDDVYSVGPENWQAYHLYNRGDIIDAVTHSAEVADLITVTTPYLADVLTFHTGNPATAVLPNFIPSWVCETPRVRRGRLSIGWQGGASHGADIGLIAAPVRRFLKRFPKWDLRLAGTDYGPSVAGPEERMIYSQWIQVNKNPKAYYNTLDFDIGLAPLLDNAFSRSKSPVKALEYMSKGMPVIASDVEPYRHFIQHGVTGFLVKEDGHSWLKYMSDLASDEKLREKMGKAAHEFARTQTIEKNWERWAQAYQAMFPARMISR